jgi:hypothetical protein
VTRSLTEEVVAARRLHHEKRGGASLEAMPADSRLWLVAIGAGFGQLMASLGPLSDPTTDTTTDPRQAAIDLIADLHAWVDAMDSRPGLSVQAGTLHRYRAGGVR